MKFEKLFENIHRLCVPFENIYTSVFAMESEGRWMLFDSGSNASDAECIVIPAIEQMGFVPDVLFASHSHGDHAGGLEALRERYPSAEVKMLADGSAYDGETVFNHFRILSLKGHSEDSAGIFDERTKTLLSGDSLQLWGVGRYGIGVQYPEEYIKTTERLLGMEIDRLIASHDYYPLGFSAEGNDVERYIVMCRECLEQLSEFVKKNNSLEIKTVADLFGKTDTGRPPVPEFVLNILRKNEL